MQSSLGDSRLSAREPSFTEKRNVPPKSVFGVGECEWAKCAKRSKAPVGTKCARCLEVTKQSWPLLSWEEILSKKAVEPQFGALVNEVMKRHAGELSKSFIPESFTYNKLSGVVLEKEFRFYPKADFQKTFACDGQEIGLPLETLTDPSGSSVQGFLLAEEDNGYK
eukprot:6489257-Amphidinium_carterae.1